MTKEKTMEKNTYCASSKSDYQGLKKEKVVGGSQSRS